MEEREKSAFCHWFAVASSEAQRIAVEHGWWDTERNQGEQIALMHSELSEALEYIRHGNRPSDHIPEFSGVEEEFADVIIRIMDTAQAYDWDVAGALLAKMDYNESRPHKHGGKAF